MKNKTLKTLVFGLDHKAQKFNPKPLEIQQLIQKVPIKYLPILQDELLPSL